MKRSWFKIASVALIAFAIIGYKQHVSSTAAEASSKTPQVLMVAVLAEANIKGDYCADIIATVRDAERRGIKVQELNYDSPSPLLKQLHVVSIPTVIIFDKQGREDVRFVGEQASTVKALRIKLASLGRA